jgi:hypothetical protein
MHIWMHPVDEATHPRSLVAGEWLGGGGGVWNGDGSVKIKCLQEAVFISHVLAHFLDLENQRASYELMI